MDLTLGARSADVRLTVHRADAATALGLGAPESLASAAGVARHAGAIVRTLGPRLTVQADGRGAPIAWESVAAGGWWFVERAFLGR